MTKEPYFVAGGRYRNRQGWYEVLEIQGVKMKVRYESDGIEEVLDMETQKRIIDNMVVDERKTSYVKQTGKHGMVNYRLSLMDIHAGIDLTKEKSAIQGVFNDILQGGPSGTAFKEVAAIDFIDIKKDSMIISVNESGTKWHAWVGKKLANDYGKRYLCLSANPEKMFNWEGI